MSVHIKARAKINLNLLVTGKRLDGYHLLSSFFAFTEFGDEISFETADSLALEITGPFAGGLTQGDGNSVIKAARALAKLCGCEPKARIILNKQIPTAAGLGGGTADAAATLLGLCKLWNIIPNPQDLHTLAVGLGADVPASLNGKPALVQGIGDVLLPAPIINEDVFIVLVNPGVSVATARVFKAFGGNFSQSFKFKNYYETAKELAEDLAKTGNDLYGPAVKEAPIIAVVLDAIKEDKNCLFAGMSGSGATCFGLYETKELADLAVEKIKQSHPDWWAISSKLYSQNL